MDLDIRDLGIPGFNVDEDKIEEVTPNVRRSERIRELSEHQHQDNFICKTCGYNEEPDVFEDYKDDIEYNQ